MQHERSNLGQPFQVTVWPVAIVSVMTIHYRNCHCRQYHCHHRQDKFFR
jgi:hypothetical protein